jgi:phosphatidylserine decarboxylase
VQELNNKGSRFQIVPMGKPIVFVSILTAIIVTHWYGFQFAWPAWCSVLGVVYVFRDPYRQIPATPLAVLAPVDGVVAEIIKIDQSLCTSSPAILIRIKKDVLSTFSMRAPIEGKMINHWRADAAFFDVAGNEQKSDLAVWLQTDEKEDVVLGVKMPNKMLGFACDTLVGERVGQGQRCGTVPFSAFIEVYLPPQSQVDVQSGHIIKSGESILATLVHQ